MVFLRDAKGTPGTTPDLPAVMAGDLVVCFAFKDTSASPGVASGWTTALTATATGTNPTGVRVSYRWWQATDTAPSFTNAIGVVAASLGGVDPTAVGASDGTSFGTSDTTLTIPTLNLARTDATSVVLAAYLHRNSTSLSTPDQMTSPIADFAPTGTERIGFAISGPVAAFTSRTVTATAAHGWRVAAVEIKNNNQAGNGLAFL